MKDTKVDNKNLNNKKPDAKNTKQKTKKKLPGVVVSLITAASFILLIAAACTLVYFNIGKSSSKIIDLLKSRSSDMDVVLRVQSDVEAREKKLEEDIKKLQSEKTLNDKKTEELKQSEIKLKEQKDEVDRLNAQATQTLSDLKYAASIYDQMETDKAALILSKMDKENIVKIFTNINKNKVTEIMAAMDPQLASDLTKIMMQE